MSPLQPSPSGCYKFLQRRTLATLASHVLFKGCSKIGLRTKSQPYHRKTNLNFFFQNYQVSEELSNVTLISSMKDCTSYLSRLIRPIPVSSRHLWPCMQIATASSTKPARWMSAGLWPLICMFSNLIKQLDPIHVLAGCYKLAHST